MTCLTQPSPDSAMNIYFQRSNRETDRRKNEPSLGDVPSRQWNQYWTRADHIVDEKRTSPHPISNVAWPGNASVYAIDPYSTRPGSQDVDRFPAACFPEFSSRMGFQELRQRTLQGAILWTLRRNHRRRPPQRMRLQWLEALARYRLLSQIGMYITENPFLKSTPPRENSPREVASLLEWVLYHCRKFTLTNLREALLGHSNNVA